MADDAELIGGRERRAIVIVDYDPTWSVHFDQHAKTIRAALGAQMLRIEHIGSTAVPGLAAKPIIDVLLVIDRPEQEDRWVPVLEQAG